MASGWKMTGVGILSLLLASILPATALAYSPGLGLVFMLIIGLPLYIIAVFLEAGIAYLVLDKAVAFWRLVIAFMIGVLAAKILQWVYLGLVKGQMFAQLWEYDTITADAVSQLLFISFVLLLSLGIQYVVMRCSFPELEKRDTAKAVLFAYLPASVLIAIPGFTFGIVEMLLGGV